jgi:hypothetical protein
LASRDEGIGWSWRAVEFLKIKRIIFYLLSQKHEKSKISKNRPYFGGPPSQSAEIRHLFMKVKV